jgi:hypothetical protein
LIDRYDNLILLCKVDHKKVMTNRFATQQRPFVRRRQTTRLGSTRACGSEMAGLESLFLAVLECFHLPYCEAEVTCGTLSTDDVTDAGLRAVRDAKRSLATDLEALRVRGLLSSVAQDMVLFEVVYYRQAGGRTHSLS